MAEQGTHNPVVAGSSPAGPTILGSASGVFVTRVWTKQHVAVLEQLKSDGRYVAKRKFVQNDLDGDAELMAVAYDYLVKFHPHLDLKPADAEVPVWLSFSLDATMQATPECAILELEIPSELITEINIAKWGKVLNYSYIPADDDDLKAHREKMAQYRVGDAEAVMSRFYPELRAEITDSWKRLFDDNVKVGNDLAYGLVWEVKLEWLQSVQQSDSI